MRLKNIELKNFRNYDEFLFSFEKQKTLIIGENAQGKTNILEGIYYLSVLDSIRIKKDSELIKFGEDFSKIRANVVKSGVDVELEVLIQPPKNKIIKVNGLKKTKHSDFQRVLSVVIFSTADLMLLRGEPAIRRKWLDNAICQIYPIYADKLAKYNKIRLQKANLLSNYPVNLDMLEVFNAQLATVGANIIFLRNKFLNELNKIANIKHKKIAQNEELEAKYENEFLAGGDISPKEIESALSAKLSELKDDEIRRAQCLVGPHRDDVSYLINGVDAKKFASQGQQRTIVLALKLAELDIIKEKNEEYPILLLDDVLAELDILRQNYLLSSIEDNIQTVITSTDTKAFSDEFLADIDVIKIQAGKMV